MEPKKQVNYIIKNIGTGLIKTVVSIVFAIVGISMIVKNIGLTKYGLISMALMFTGFSGILDLGLSKSLIIFKNTPEKNREKEVYAILLINILISSLIIILALLFYWFVDAKVLGQYSSYENKIVISSALFLLGIEMFNNLLRAILEAEYKLHYVNYSFIVQIVVLNVGWILLSFQHVFVLDYYMMVAALAGVLSLVFQLFFVSRSNFRKHEIGRENMKNVFRMTSNFFAIGTLNSLHVPGLKLLFALFSASAKAIGILEITLRLAFMINSLMAYISNPLFSLASGASRENTPNVFRLSKRVFYLISGVSVFGYAIFLIIQRPLILNFYNQYNETIFTCLNTMLIAFLLLAISEPIQKLSQGLGHLRTNINIKFLSIAVNAIIVFYLIWMDRLDLFGISLSFLLSISVSTLIWIYLFLSKNQIFAVE